MLGAEEVAAGRHRLDRLEAEVVLVERHRAQELHHVLQDLDVENELLEGGRQPPSSQPAAW